MPFLVIGLGNPGSKYAETRHNAGFWFLDRLAEKSGLSLRRSLRLHSHVAKGNVFGHDCVLARPRTFMNESGRAVRAVIDYYRAKAPQVLVAYDELDLPPGMARLKQGGGHGGHNGLRDIIAHCGRDFMRPITQTLYGIPPERVVGSSVKLSFQADDKGATLMREAGANFVDDGPGKPVAIWERIGRRPIFAAGNANGDIPMLQYTDMNAKPSLCLLVNHDDGDREFDYTAGAEDAMKLAKKQGWTVVSVKQDWKQVFASKNA